jgi:hypothetical protein
MRIIWLQLLQKPFLEKLFFKKMIDNGEIKKNWKRKALVCTVENRYLNDLLILYFSDTVLPGVTKALSMRRDLFTFFKRPHSGTSFCV